MPALLILLAAVCFGTTGTALALGPDSASPASAGAVRIVVGGALLAMVVFARRSSRRGAPPRAAARLRVPTVVLVLVGAAAIVAYQPTFFLGTTRAGVAVGTIVALGSAPIFTGLLEWVATRRFPGTVWIVATVVASVGVALLGGALEPGSSRVDPVGIAGSLGAGASYAVYALVAKLLLMRGAHSTWSMGALFGSAAAVSLPIALTTDLSWLARPDGVATAVWLGVVTTGVAYVLFGRGLSDVRASTAATLTLVEPLTAALLGVLILGETLAATAASGIAVVAAGLLVLVVPRRGGAPRRSERVTSRADGF
ncbi:EamA family transporter [Labedella phragmitis]|uniref:EamA family transporter n=1 Tax=Labedella phragmitis TaxID=2498849 RepID=A0A444PUP8_9MICO|nr:EamA family transporter [Labedella phragmitis]RWZ51582.1 EamA family transporter [Labedella phragmitis]